MTTEERLDKLDQQMDMLRDLFFIRVLYNNCMHHEGVYCTNHAKDIEACQCSRENCPLFDNPWDI